MTKAYQPKKNARPEPTNLISEILFDENYLTPQEVAAGVAFMLEHNFYMDSWPKPDHAFVQKINALFLNTARVWYGVNFTFTDSDGEHGVQADSECSLHKSYDKIQDEVVQAIKDFFDSEGYYLPAIETLHNFYRFYNMLPKRNYILPNIKIGELYEIADKTVGRIEFYEYQDREGFELEELVGFSANCKADENGVFTHVCLRGATAEHLHDEKFACVYVRIDELEAIAQIPENSLERLKLEVDGYLSLPFPEIPNGGEIKEALYQYGVSPRNSEEEDKAWRKLDELVPRVREGYKGYEKEAYLKDWRGKCVYRFKISHKYDTGLWKHYTGSRWAE